MKVKHFEDLWVNAETLSKEILSNIETTALIDNIKKTLTEFNNNNIPESKAEVLGLLLLGVASLSDRYNINVYKSLAIAMDEAKVAHLEGEPIFPF